MIKKNVKPIIFSGKYNLIFSNLIALSGYINNKQE